MNHHESRTILAVLQAAFPAFYRGISDDKMLKIVKLWQSMFADDDYEVVSKAVKALIATKVEDFPPTIGAVKEQIVKLTQPEQMSELEAWSLVNKACRNGSHHALEEFNKLPDVVQRAVGSVDQLRVWAQMDEATVNSVISSNFMRSFRVKQSQQKELDMLTSDVKSFISSMSEEMKLGSHNDKKSIGSADRVMITSGEMPVVNKPEDVLPAREPYKVPDDNEWEKMREAALKSLEVRAGA